MSTSTYKLQAIALFVLTTSIFTVCVAAPQTSVDNGAVTRAMKVASQEAANQTLANPVAVYPGRDVTFKQTSEYIQKINQLDASLRKSSFDSEKLSRIERDVRFKHQRLTQAALWGNDVETLHEAQSFNRSAEQAVPIMECELSRRSGTGQTTDRTCD